jgi:ubiquinol-cytochrome c reductase cytochrome b subunit
VIRGAFRWVDDRLGAAPLVKKALRYVFPDHWSFMLGEIALYAFVVLVATGIFLAFFYEPSSAKTVYNGSYEPLKGMVVGKNYASTVNLSLDVPGGLLIRQMHHWAANVFIVAIVLHVLRIVLTGAFRKPREINYWIGVTMAGLAIFEGFAGYSLPDDLLSGMGLAIAYGVAMSIPVLGDDFAFQAWGGQYPGSADFWPRLFTVHILIVPVILAVLITLHLTIIARQHHSQFPGRRETEDNVVGTPLWPGYALRSLGLLFAVTAVVTLLGGLVQVNPIWEWGPYEPDLSTSGAQPDWYLGWLIGALRLIQPIEPVVGNYTLVPNPFWGGVLFPTVVFAVLYLWPVFDRRFIGDRRRHDLLDRPRDNPRRTGLGVAFFIWVFTIFGAGAADRISVLSDIPYEGQVWGFRILALVLPVVAYFLTKAICEELRDRELHPLRGLGEAEVVPAREREREPAGRR